MRLLVLVLALPAVLLAACGGSTDDGAPVDLADDVTACRLVTAADLSAALDHRMEREDGEPDDDSCTYGARGEKWSVTVHVLRRHLARADVAAVRRNHADRRAYTPVDGIGDEAWQRRGVPILDQLAVLDGKVSYEVRLYHLQAADDLGPTARAAAELVSDRLHERGAASSG